MKGSKTEPPAIGRRAFFTNVFSGHLKPDAATPVDLAEGQIEVAIIDQKSCMAWNKTMCYTCVDRCPERAIKMQGLFNPVVDQVSCKGCHQCAPDCPTQAITMEIHENECI